MKGTPSVDVKAASALMVDSVLAAGELAFKLSLRGWLMSENSGVNEATAVLAVTFPMAIVAIVLRFGSWK